MSIRSFTHKGLYLFFEKGNPKGIAADDIERIRRILDVLHNATSKSQLKFHGFGFHRLNPKVENRYAMKVDKRFRITFIWDDANGDALRVNLKNYHH